MLSTCEEIKGRTGNQARLDPEDVGMTFYWDQEEVAGLRVEKGAYST